MEETGLKRKMFQHTAARRRLGQVLTMGGQSPKFQHTAARRRLEAKTTPNPTISRFNTQPPEGGWNRFFGLDSGRFLFQHTAARRRLGAYSLDPRAKV